MAEGARRRALQQMLAEAHAWEEDLLADAEGGAGLGGRLAAAEERVAARTAAAKASDLVPASVLKRLREIEAGALALAASAPGLPEGVGNDPAWRADLFRVGDCVRWRVNPRSDPTAVVVAVQPDRGRDCVLINQSSSSVWVDAGSLLRVGGADDGWGAGDAVAGVAEELDAVERAASAGDADIYAAESDLQKLWRQTRDERSRRREERA